MRFGVRIGVVTLALAALLSSPAMADRRKVLGVVLQTDRARLDGASAAMGANIYSCDSLETDDGGTLRARVGSGQVYLSSFSAAALEDHFGSVQMLAIRGTVGFSSPVAGEITILTPAGVVRGAAAQAAGQVAFTGPNTLVISAMHGDIVLDNGGEFRTIPEGKSAAVTFEGNVDIGCHDEVDIDQKPQHPLVRRRLGFYIVSGAAAGITSLIIWRELNESESKPGT